MSKSELLVEEKEVVVPGQVVAKGKDYSPGDGTYRLDDKVVANRLGLIEQDGKVLKSIYLSGRYLPKEGDMIIGKITDIRASGWRVNINSAYTAMLSLKDASHKYIERGEDLSQYFALEDHVVAKITSVTTQNLVDVTCKGDNLKKLKGGRIIKVSPNKVPRIIGKRGSMVSMIKKYTDCQITVGQNGIVWIKGEPENEVVAIDAIKKIERESHVKGLTEEVEGYLQEEMDNLEE